MESELSGKYSNYSNGYGLEKKDNKNDPSSNCPDKLIFVLEDVGRCPYYKSNNKVPAIGYAVKLKDKLYNNRLAIEDLSNTVIGLVPVEYNSIHECIKAEIKYYGTVTDSYINPTIHVQVEIERR